MTRIIIIGNYSLLKSRSMNMYANNLKKILKNKNKKIHIMKPKIILNILNFKSDIIKKWLGYIDNYILFGIYVFFRINKKDIVYVCDQSNSLLYLFIRAEKKIITCHDLINLKLHKLSKQKIRSFNGKIHDILILFFLKKFHNIICVSRKTSSDLKKAIKVNFLHKNVKTIYNTLNYKFTKINLKKKNLFKQKNKIENKYFLHVGGNNWYKNKINLIKIFYEFSKLNKNKEFRLILLGKKISNEILILIKKLKIEKKVINITDVSPKNLNYYYANAEALIFPSLDEGFGWPIIEAQASGCPVFTNNKPPMNEIGLNSVFYINPKNLKKSAKFIDHKINNTNYMIKKGYNNVNRFDFKKISNEHQIYLDNIIKQKL